MWGKNIRIYILKFVFLRSARVWFKFRTGRIKNKKIILIIIILLDKLIEFEIFTPISIPNPWEDVNCSSTCLSKI